MSRFNVMPRTYRLRAWLCDHIAPPGYANLNGLWTSGKSEPFTIKWTLKSADEPPRISPPEAYEWRSPPPDMPPPEDSETMLRRLEAKDTP